MSRNIIGSVFFFAALAGCSTSGDSVIGTITEAVNPTDWTDNACESPIYQEMIGTFSGELSFSAADRSCVWSSTVVVNGTSEGATCTLKGSIDSTLIQQGAPTRLPYTCNAGVLDVTFTSGLRVGDDLISVRPESMGFNYLPSLEQLDVTGNELIHPVTQYEYVVVDYRGLSALNGLLERQQP